MRVTLGCAVAASLLLVENSYGWLSLSPPPPAKSKTTAAEYSLMTRRTVLNGVAVAFLGSTMLAGPDNARADVTNKVASTAALRSLRRAQAQLPKLKPTVLENDFVAVKTFLRNPPFDEVRKNGFILVRGGEDGPKASELQASYRKFIASVEKIDSSASLGMRGRKVPTLQMTEEYDNILAAMESFLKVSRNSNAEFPTMSFLNVCLLYLFLFRLITAG
jgi:hypothetical protein